jgi:hypothetical protein
MLTTMTDADRTMVLKVFEASPNALERAFPARLFTGDSKTASLSGTSIDDVIRNYLSVETK